MTKSGSCRRSPAGDVAMLGTYGDAAGLVRRNGVPFMGRRPRAAMVPGGAGPGLGPRQVGS